MTTRDKEIIHQILNYIGSDDKLETDIAKYVGKYHFNMTPGEFSDWLRRVDVLEKVPKFDRFKPRGTVDCNFD